MPGVRGHDLITVVTGVAMTMPAYRLFSTIDPGRAGLDTALLVGAHLLSGTMFSPDLDLDSAIDDRWGAFYWIWRPYMMIMPHRHFWSHGLVLAPLLRLGYFYLVIQCLILAVAWALAQVGVILPNYHERLAAVLVRLYEAHPTQVLVFLLGFMLGSAAHTGADWLVTGGKRYLTRMGYRPRREYMFHDQELHSGWRRATRRGGRVARGW